MPGICPTPERLAAALRNPQPGAGDAELAAHLADCPACRTQLEALAGGSGWLEAKARTHTAATPSEPLRQAMHALESQPGLSERESPAPFMFDFLQPADQPGMIGRFGAYHVLEHVASGGMGIVLKARDPALDRVVALKILPPALATNSLARARFVREARAAAAVVHEHVVPIYAVDESAGLPYLVMQFVHGRSLSERIRLSGPLRLEEILRIGAQTAAGLAAAHAQGLIHRDVKPGNILLENSIERVKLTDFGLARAVDETGLTRTGELAGTPEFMSPEQAGNEPVDHRADLFSLGSVLYAMSTGFSPFQGNTVVAVIRKVCDQHPPPVHEINSAIPRWLSDLIVKLMAKSPDERFQSAREVGELLERYLARAQHGELGALAQHRPRRSRAAYAVGAVASLAVMGLLIFLLKAGFPFFAGDGSRTATGLAFGVRDATDRILGAYADLAEAVRAAPPAGVVEFRWDGPREMPPVTLPPKPLTLRVAKGFRPAWIHTNLSVSALSASAPLTMEDLELSLRPDAIAAPGRPRPRARLIPSGVGLIAISNAPLRLSRCVLQLPDPRSQARGSQLGAGGLTAIVLHNVATCELENSALLAQSSTAFLWRRTAEQNLASTDARSEARLSLSNCVVTAFHAFSIESPENGQTRLQLVRNTFRVVHLLFPAPTAAGAINVFARTNLFSGATIVVDGRTTNREVFTASMRWQGSHNLFSLSNRGSGRPWGYIVLGNTSGPATLAQWNQWWPEPETDSREVAVQFAGPIEAPAAGSADFVRTAYKITSLNVTEGTPLPADQWSRFGADMAAVGPASR